MGDAILDVATLLRFTFIAHLSSYRRLRSGLTPFIFFVICRIGPYAESESKNKLEGSASESYGSNHSWDRSHGQD